VDKVCNPFQIKDAGECYLAGCYAIYIIHLGYIQLSTISSMCYYLIPASNHISKLPIFIMYLLGPQPAPEDFRK
jgi:hypothetical protein